MQLFDTTVNDLLKQRLADLESHFDADVIFYYGAILEGLEKLLREFIEKLKDDGIDKTRLVIILNTPGGSVEIVEKMVEIIRYHYDEVYFIVPDFAMSAGTIFCMSGDKIYMDYSSSLGPIDPQVFNGKDWVPALGYLDQVEKLLKKARDNELSHAELLILAEQDLAMLSRYEQARELTVTLLKKWLVEYKFKDWRVHETTTEKVGKQVTLEEKKERAESIAIILGDNKTWHSHGRLIGIKTIKEVLKLKIEDYSTDKKLKDLIRSYNDLIVQYIVRMDYPYFIHGRIQL